MNSVEFTKPAQRPTPPHRMWWRKLLYPIASVLQLTGATAIAFNLFPHDKVTWFDCAVVCLIGAALIAVAYGIRRLFPEEFVGRR